MKRFIAALAIIMACSLAAVAQKGDLNLGVNLGVAPCLEKDTSWTTFGLGAKMQYGFTDNVRGELEFTYWFEDKEVSALELAANFHYLFNISETFKMYPIVGIGYGSPRTSYHGVTSSINRFLFNLGLGAEYAFSEHIVGCLEVKYQYMKDFNRMPITVGVAYKF